MIGFEIGFCGCSLGNDQFLSGAFEIADIIDRVFLGGNNTELNLHVRQCEVNLLCTFRCHGEVGKNDVYLSGLRKLHTVCRIQGNIFHLRAKILCDPLCEVDIVSGIVSVFIHIAKRCLVGEDADLYGSAFPDFIQCAVNGLLCGIVGGGSSAAGG